jgi:GrpB-like predicted nucleotidyltransferase (UPF0157 family)
MRRSAFDSPGDQWPRLDVVVVPYDPAWAARFELEATIVRSALGPRLSRIEHFGSTSVVGLAAKPIVDILVELSSALSQDDLAALAQGGYVHVRHVDDPDIVFLGKGNHEVHMQLVPVGHASVSTKLAVRDYLRHFAEEARAYAAVKNAVSESAKGVAKEYALGKRAFVDALEARALTWAEGRRE